MAISPPPIRTTFLDRDKGGKLTGYVSWPWIKWLEQLFQSTNTNVTELDIQETQDVQALTLVEQALAEAALNQQDLGIRQDDIQDVVAQVAMLLSETPQPPATMVSVGGPVLTASAPAAPDTDFAVAHSLGVTPVGYIVVGRDMATTIYNGTTSWDSSNIYLRSAIGGASISLLVF